MIRLCFVFLLSMIALPATAQIQMDRVVVGTSGGRMSNGSVQLDLTVGQSAAGEAILGSQTVQVGFWWQVTTSTVSVEPTGTSTKFALGQLAPNPFVSQTTIRYAVPSEYVGSVFLGVYDVRGSLVKELKNEAHAPGNYVVTWNGQMETGGRVSAGIYFITIKAGTFNQTRKTLVLK